MKYVGRTELVSIPDLGIEMVNAKIDTGAYGNALHVDEVSIKDNKLVFVINKIEHVYKKYKTIIVRNSFGKKQKRFSIITNIYLGDNVYKIQVSLTNRGKMKYPMLIGRRFLRKFDYIVNVNEKNINDKPKTL